MLDSQIFFVPPQPKRTLLASDEWTAPRGQGKQQPFLFFFDGRRRYDDPKDTALFALTPLLELPQLSNSNPTLRTLFE